MGHIRADSRIAVQCQREFQGDAKSRIPGEIGSTPCQVVGSIGARAYVIAVVVLSQKTVVNALGHTMPQGVVACRLQVAGQSARGEVLAQRIVDYRTRHGSFTAPEQLTMVEGIGEGRAEAILDLVTVGG